MHRRVEWKLQYSWRSKESLPHISVTLTYCNAIGNGASSVDAFFRLLTLPERFSIFQPTSPNHVYYEYIQVEPYFVKTKSNGLLHSIIIHIMGKNLNELNISPVPDKTSKPFFWKPYWKVYNGTGLVEILYVNLSLEWIKF